jgi:nucleotide-binding universal stress UspA family protein
MPTLERVLCAIDFSDASRDALRHAASLAAAQRGRLRALHVVQIATPVATGYPLSYPASVWTPEDLARLEADLRRFVDLPGLQVPVDTEVAMGHIAGTIVERAASLPADLLVIGTHGRSGFERLVLGSVAERVVRHAPCPVLTIPPGAAAEGEPAGRYRRILCAVDFSRDSLRGLDYAAQLARSSGGSIDVIHVVEPLPAYVPAVPGAPLREYDETISEDVVRHLHEVVAGVAGPDLTVRKAVVSGRPHERILEAARRNASDLIVAGIAGRGAVDLAFFGSTANQILRRAECPVLTVKPGTA